MNPMQMLGNVMRSGGNPQNLIMNMMQRNMGNNPMMQNVYKMVQNKDEKGLEQLARNLAKENGIDVEQGLKMIKDNMGF